MRRLVKRVVWSHWAGGYVTQRRWHPMRVAMLYRLAPVMERQALAKYLGVSETTLRRKAERMGIALRSSRPTPYTASELRFMRRNRTVLTYEEIADALGRSRCAVRFAMQRRGWHRRWRVGEDHPHCKHPDKDVQLAWALREEGVAVREIAEKLEVPLSTVKSWLYFGIRATTEELSQ